MDNAVHACAGLFLCMFCLTLAGLLFGICACGAKSLYKHLFYE